MHLRIRNLFIAFSIWFLFVSLLHMELWNKYSFSSTQRIFENCVVGSWFCDCGWCALYVAWFFWSTSHKFPRTFSWWITIIAIIVLSCTLVVNRHEMYRHQMIQIIHHIRWIDARSMNIIQHRSRRLAVIDPPIPEHHPLKLNQIENDPQPAVMWLIEVMPVIKPHD